MALLIAIGFAYVSESMRFRDSVRLGCRVMVVCFFGSLELVGARRKVSEKKLETFCTSSDYQKC